MAARVLEIARGEMVAKPARAPRAGQTARVYRFPSRTPLDEPKPGEGAPRSRFRLHLALELAIALALWLTWYLCQHAH